MALLWRTSKDNFPDATGPSFETCILASTGMDPDAYMRTMTVGTGSKITPEQWGGFFEASVMAHHYHIRVAIFNKVLDSDGRANFTPVITFGHQQAESLKGTIAVAYNGNHYSVLKISPDIIKALT